MKLKEFFSQPEVLIGLGIGSMLTGVVTACKATLSAHEKIESRKKELGVEKLPVKEIAKIVAPRFATTVVLEGAGMGMIGAGAGKYSKSIGELATGLALSEATRQAFEEKTKEVIGEKKVNEIRDEIAKEQNAQQPVVVTGSRNNGEKIFVDTLVNHEFYLRSVSELDLLEKDMELDIVNYNFVSVNEWLSRLHISPVDSAIGDLGWGPETGFQLRRTWIENDNGEPVCLVSHITPPLPREKAEGCWGA